MTTLDGPVVPDIATHVVITHGSRLSSYSLLHEYTGSTGPFLPLLNDSQVLLCSSSLQVLNFDNVVRSGLLHDMGMGINQYNQ